jgi:DNA modification methylase
MSYIPIPNTTEKINTVIHGDALKELSLLLDNSIDAIVCDPPSAINFMGKEWDSDRGGRTMWVAWLAGIMLEAKRVLKPGGYAVVWALPRTSHWTAWALEDAGFEIREKLYHLFGSGFPKSLDVSKALDKMAGAEREIVGSRIFNDITGHNYNNPRAMPDTKLVHYTKSATDEAKHWQGYGTATKPAAEEWILCRKPLSEKNVAANVLKWGTGAINIDGCRVGTSADMSPRDFDDSRRKSPKFSGILNGGNTGQYRASSGQVPNGRWPANVLLSHSIWCQPIGTKRVRGDGHKTIEPIVHNGTGFFGNDEPGATTRRYNGPDGLEEVQAWQCVDGCPVKELDSQSGQSKSSSRARHNNPHTPNAYSSFNEHRTTHGHDDQGGASRFFPNFEGQQDELQDEIEQWECVDGCPVKELDSQSGQSKSTKRPPTGRDDRGIPGFTIRRNDTTERGHDDTGGASRYFTTFLYTSKASRSERNAGCQALPAEIGFNKNSSQVIQRLDPDTGETTYSDYNPQPQKNFHPTVKPIKLMQWLVRLICPHDGIVLDMFGGSGTTALAALAEGKRFILIEEHQPYVDIARARIAHMQQGIQ